MGHPVYIYIYILKPTYIYTRTLHATIKQSGTHSKQQN